MNSINEEDLAKRYSSKQPSIKWSNESKTGGDPYNVLDSVSNLCLHIISCDYVSHCPKTCRDNTIEGMPKTANTYN